ncbi:hypothetical protein IEZ26_18400 [Nocardioides cavernae]|uniref:Uncharacterized protein n=1 Tax=Nocardioides cavernae TaxID=1921566 RepID=A0ABR8NEQ4_9ACTN|nr:hypothetical protein [Nocardioides cavernae]MBD3926597.1 hypothetical protein [Nocardioides cavernae]MBM7512319.1 hypothetical protein [Nocardioides cavernae]
MFPRRLIGLAALLAPVALLLPAAAHAETVVTVDPVGDARAWTYFQEFQYVPAPQEASADVIRTAAAFVPRRLSVAVHLRDLQVRPRHDTLVRIWTPRDIFDVTAERLSAQRATVSVARQRGDAFGCRGLSVAYDGAADTVALSVPARCIGSPRWVRLGVEVTATPEADPEAQTAIVHFADDGHRGGVSENSVGKGPRIHRG